MAPATPITPKRPNQNVADLQSVRAFDHQTPIRLTIIVAHLTESSHDFPETKIDSNRVY